ncbi:MAG: aldehyde dehydrogenase [Phycisphaerales bacterium]|nr:aldehyde dehydrogenase [Phycisphaerales bacterium]
MSSCLISINPFSHATVGSLPMTSLDAIPALVARARVAGELWKSVPMSERVSCLKAAAARLKEEASRLGAIASQEMGKPLLEAVGEANYCADSFASEADNIAAALTSFAREDERTASTIHFEPFGVVAAITPWNFPMLILQQSVLPALIAGNAVVAKASEITPMVADAYYAILNEFLPTDVLITVVGDGEQGKALVASSVDLIVFTGSRNTGAHIGAVAGKRLARVILELGGKDPLVVLDDADIALAADFASRNSFRNAGQVCVSTERIYVDRKIASAFESAVVERAALLKLGDPADATTKIGPMSSARQKALVDQHIQKALKDGARLLFGARKQEGNFVEPTVLAGVDHTMEIMREETFGPVACIMEFDGIDQAVMLANDTPFGLGAAVFGADEVRATHVAARLTAGMVGVNQGCSGAEGCPWIGAKQSGVGFHSGVEGHRQFAQMRVLSRKKKS